MRYLLFPLYAPLASWGDVSVGEFRPSFAYPSRSAVLGLLAAALGVDRSDEPAHVALSRDLGVAVAVYEEGSLLRDYHTAQVPGAVSLKKRPHRTRADELSIPRDQLHTILSTRDYRQDAVSLVCLWEKSQAMRWSLEALTAAIECPKFVLYLGRKACPPALPIRPQLVDTADITTAVSSVAPTLEELSSQLGFEQKLVLRRLAWEHGAASGCAASFSVPRKDEFLSRGRWQFGDRTEHVFLAPGAEGSPEGQT